MNVDYATLDLLRQSHPAWRLLRSDHAPLVASFLQRVFIEPNVRTMTQADLTEALEDELFGLRERMGADSFPKSALVYLNDWAAAERGWLRWELSSRWACLAGLLLAFSIFCLSRGGEFLYYNF